MKYHQTCPFQIYHQTLKIVYGSEYRWGFIEQSEFLLIITTDGVAGRLMTIVCSDHVIKEAEAQID